MPIQFRRHELLLPTNFNDGSAVPQKLLGQTLRDSANNSARSLPRLNRSKANGNIAASFTAI